MIKKITTCDVCAKQIDHSHVLTKMMNGQRIEVKIDVCIECKESYYKALAKEFTKEMRYIIKKNAEMLKGLKKEAIK